MEPDKCAPIGEKPSVTSEGVTKGYSLLSEGITSLAEAFAAADSEMGEATPVDVPEAMPAAGADDEVRVEQAEAGDVDQPEVAETQPAEVDEELQSLIDEIGDKTESEDSVDGEDGVPSDAVEGFLASDDFWNTEIEVDLGAGPQPMTIEQLTENAMMQADYTRKTQALAAERKGFEQAVEFHQAFNENPGEFARLLAVRAGLINEGDTPVRDVEAVKIPSQEEIEQQINDAVEERFTSDPRYAEMQATSARAEVNAEFDRIETDRGIKLSPEVRQSIINTAVASNTTDLEMVLNNELYRQSQQKARTAERQRNAPSRPTKSGGPVEREPTNEPPADVGDAMERALAELSA